MIGFYDYTVILTYMSLLSAVTGIALASSGHPILATMCLLFCGLCDMFDGKVARAKKNRTQDEKSFGIQIDSLCDVVAFGVLPGVLTMSLCDYAWYAVAVAGFFTLAGVIRLAYYNVTEELRQQKTDEVRKTYSGLPITSSALIFPIFYCAISVYCLRQDNITLFGELFRGGTFRLVLCSLTGVTGLCFITPFHIRKPQSRELMLFLILGICIALILFGAWLHFTLK